MHSMLIGEWRDAASDIVSLPGSESSARVSQGGDMLITLLFSLQLHSSCHQEQHWWRVSPVWMSLTFGQCSSAEPSCVDHSGTLYALQWMKQLVALKFWMSCCCHECCFSAQDEVDWCHDPKLRTGCGCSRKVVGLIWSMRASSPRCSDQKLQDANVGDKRMTMWTDGAEKLVSIGELSAARQALEGASVAPGTLHTLQELTNPEKRLRPTLAKPTLAILISDFGIRLWPNRLCPEKFDRLWPTLIDPLWPNPF